MHIGLDTVKMQEWGFTPKAVLGQDVTVGDELISFDMDMVAAQAVSVLTQSGHHKLPSSSTC